jgi:hypothetical protein
MDIDDLAAQQQMGAIAAQHTLIGMTDRPEQFREPPLSALFRQAWRERYGYSELLTAHPQKWSSRLR